MGGGGFTGDAGVGAGAGIVVLIGGPVTVGSVGGQSSVSKSAGSDRHAAPSSGTPANSYSSLPQEVLSLTPSTWGLSLLKRFHIHC